jgi:hypothetical protein
MIDVILSLTNQITKKRGMLFLREIFFNTNSRDKFFLMLNKAVYNMFKF